MSFSDTETKPKHFSDIVGFTGTGSYCVTTLSYLCEVN